MDKECEKYWKKERPLMLVAHMSRAKERWEAAFSPDYDREFSLVSMKTKLENMADYFKTLAPIVNGPYYAGQMALAAKLLDIVIREGSNDEYRDVESDDPSDWHRPDDFIPNVNMKNAHRFIDKTDKALFWCDAQCIEYYLLASLPGFSDLTEEEKGRVTVVKFEYEDYPCLMTDEVEFPDFRKAIDHCNQLDRPEPDWETLSSMLNKD